MDDLNTVFEQRIDEAFSRFQSAYALLDYCVYQPLSGILEEAEKKISCHKGCDACCCRIVLCSRIEAVGIIEFIEQNLSKRAAELKSRISAHSEKIQKFIFSQDCAKNPEEYSLWFAKKTPCPFLEKGSCLIYQARPLACRTYHSLENPRKCRNPLRQVRQLKLLTDADHLFLIIIQKIGKRFSDQMAVRGVLTITLDMLFKGMETKTDNP